MSLKERIDAGLAKYYKLRGRNDYLTEDGTGKFVSFCDDNGFEDDNEIKQELDADPSDCMLLEFDDLFPIDPIGDNDDEESKLYRIINVLRVCMNKGDAWNETDFLMNDMKMIYKNENICNVKIYKNKQNENNKLSLIVHGFIGDMTSLFSSNIIMLIIDYSMIDIFGSIIMMIHCQFKSYTEKSISIQQINDNDNDKLKKKPFDSRAKMDQQNNLMHAVQKLLYPTEENNIYKYISSDIDSNNYEICFDDLDLNDITKELKQKRIEIDLCDMSFSMHTGNMGMDLPSFIIKLLHCNQYKDKILYNKYINKWYFCHQHKSGYCNDVEMYTYYGLLTNSIKNDSETLCFSFIIRPTKQYKYIKKKRCPQCHALNNESNNKSNNKSKVKGTLKCSQCYEWKEKDMFSKTQMLKRGNVRKCKQCIQSNMNK